NMEASRDIPTATSVRSVPAKLLEENRAVINRYLEGGRGGKVSFTHLIGWAVVRALEAVPVMQRSFARPEGKPVALVPDAVHLGIAVDVTRAGGSRSLLVPNIKAADRMDFAAFWAAYEDVIRKVRTNALSPDDFAGTTVTITNPGTVGTQLSVPRLMPGQGLIVGVGRVGYPSEFHGADPAALAGLGVGKVIGFTSTYDHRVIQGAESGEFLAKLEGLLLGEDGFYEGVFASLGVPYEPARWSVDRDHGATPAPWATPEKQAHVLRLINLFRVRGHLLANLDPLGPDRVLAHPELDPAYHGLTVWDLDRRFFADDLPGERERTLRDVLDLLRDAYCGTIGIEYMHIQDPEQKRWIQHRVEGVRRDLPPEDKRHVLERLNAAEAFERFLHSRYVGHKRFSLEGAESVIPMLDVLLEDAAAGGAERVIMGMAHRGRLNVVANIVGKSHAKIFRSFEGDIDPETTQGSGDVKYHLGASGKFTSRAGTTIAVELASNPSHLEAVDPVVEGMARAAQDEMRDGRRTKVIPVLIHGDAAFAGQGVVAETLGMSQLSGFTTGGTVHVVINNQLGFTTPPKAGRSSVYATDIAKMVQAPIFHVNGDDPEACVWLIRLAFAFRQAFQTDVVVDLVCYRRYGHNEADDPSYTQPRMYQKIEERRSVRKLYMETLVNRGDITLDEAEAALEDYRSRLEQAFNETKESAPPANPERLRPAPIGVRPPVETGVEREVLDRILRTVTSWPDGFTPHPKLARQLEKRRDLLERDAVDWALGEQLAFGSLLLEGTPVRLTGQDTRRGTFSQRHAVLVDHETEHRFYPLAHLSEDQATFLVFDSPLNEFAALGFEYGESIEARDALICWEAQFGDFINEAQVIVDQFIVAGEEKWGETSGLVLLLPHGFEGQGPEHSSGRLERFLELAAEDNIQVAVPSTPAQYFHLLRRQMRRDLRKPLVVMTPKRLLRLPAARSRAQDLVAGHFDEVLPDPAAPAADGVRAVILSSGKVFYELDERRQAEAGAGHVALVRIEQLYPFPGRRIRELLAGYPNVERVRWVQEEPDNMGAYRFVHWRQDRFLPDGVTFDQVSRAGSGSPAAGSTALHEQEQDRLLRAAFEGL
ncbi:MAG TPA: multifunctional oxoglutarate decarboxylase/oxoglutarate dehydrogenase thiamine pyrophosphate-binding subunit/dihydrolipoyllysine-residue succinyltransferase subunit, partial [Actinomycetota bacterium]|nr:multifunctional oxoglutarate decarboxylase/oxoglutarate dehydrogenase thiamine pyrophosphate-binding subunit/dihydrolipoyllysine-residue succinyltransferase subunit [Actinomycetota bacterium]